ncbi:unnamed protein product, partial [Protopolystoma xenopodis]
QTWQQLTFDYFVSLTFFTACTPTQAHHVLYPLKCYKSQNQHTLSCQLTINRFYYKDLMLRKARQQLHFQFAMPFVEWSTRFTRANFKFGLQEPWSGGRNYEARHTARPTSTRATN